MSPLTYCPKCWPYDLGEYDTNQRCTDCGTSVRVAEDGAEVDLLLEQNAALTRCLGEAMEAVDSLVKHPHKAGTRQGDAQRARLRLVGKRRPK